MEYQNLHRHTGEPTDAFTDGQISAMLREDGWVPDRRRGLALLKRKQFTSRQRRHRFAALTVCIAGVLAVGLATPATRAFAGRCAAACVAESGRVSQFLVSRISTPLRGERQTAPDFSLPDSDGRPIQLSAYRGRVVVLNFWATWCPPCLTEMPWFSASQRKHGAAGLSVIGMSMDEGGWHTVRSFLRERNPGYPIVIGNDQISAGFGGVVSIPSTFIIDRSGRIFKAHVGLMSREMYEAEIAAALAER